MLEGMVDTRSSSGDGKDKKSKNRRHDKSKKQSQPKQYNASGGGSDKHKPPPPAPPPDEDDGFDPDDDIDWADVIEGLIQDGSISVYLDAPPELLAEMEEQSEQTPRAAGRGGKGVKKRARDKDDDNPASSSYDMEHRKFYWDLSGEKRARIAELERQLDEARQRDGRKVPSRFRLLESGASPAIKSAVMTRVEGLFSSNSHPSEKSKLTKWLDAFLRIPFGIRRPLPVSHDSPKDDIRRFIVNTKIKLDDNIYGHADAKEQIIRTLAKWISNPHSKGTIIGIQGPPGCGKTTLVRNCIAKALDLPMVMIPLGGVTDSSVLNGHLYTYEGSTYGAVANCLMNAKCMNPVFLLDELDKVGGDSHRGQEVVNTLIHMTDPVQNENFSDHYFADVPIDLSKSLMVLTFNNLEAINPILRDRMSIIKTSGYVLKDKKHIAQKHLLPRIAAQHGMSGLTITDAGVEEIVKRVESESGVRNLERAIDTIVGNINLARMVSESNEDNPSDQIDRGTVVEHIPEKSRESFSAQHMYM